jgi:putative phosphoribosyl transferase
MFATGVLIRSGGVDLAGDLSIPEGATALVVFVHGSGSSRMSPRNRQVAHALNQAGFATLLFDLLAETEEGDRAAVFDIGLLATRLTQVLVWLRERADVGSMAVGLFGASTGAAAALVCAAQPGSDVSAVVSRGGRPDLALAALDQVKAPTLLIVGGADDVVLELNEQAARQLRCEHRVLVIPGATHLFEEAGALEAVSSAAIAWFGDHL